MAWMIEIHLNNWQGQQCNQQYVSQQARTSRDHLHPPRHAKLQGLMHSDSKDSLEPSSLPYLGWVSVFALLGALFAGATSGVFVVVSGENLTCRRSVSIEQRNSPA